MSLSINYKVSNLHRIDKNTLRASFDLELGFAGIVLRGTACTSATASAGSAGPPSHTLKKTARSLGVI
jgi:hypothetical protein